MPIYEIVDVAEFLGKDSKNLKELVSFSNAKKIISELLQLKIKARSGQQLENVLRKILLVFNNDDFNVKAALFEKNKIRNFKR